MEVTPTSLTTAPSLYLNIIYKRLTLIAVYHIDFPVTVPNLHLIPVPLPVSTTHKDKVTTNIL